MIQNFHGHLGDGIFSIQFRLKKIFFQVFAVDIAKSDMGNIFISGVFFEFYFYF